MIVRASLRTITEFIEEATVFRQKSKYFKVVQNDRNELAVWHADASLDYGWRETGKYGSENECWDYVEGRGRGGFFLKFVSLTAAVGLLIVNFF